MKLINTDIEGLFIVEPIIFRDDRGFFFESYSEKKFQDQNVNINFVQDNRSLSSYGTIRGLHMQANPKTQTKLISVLSGHILDVVVDCRKDSKTYKEVRTFELDSEKKHALLIPKGFLHGFVVLSDVAQIFYKVDEFYSKEHEIGVRFDDPSLAIDWKIDSKKLNLSEKDKKLLSFNDFIKTIEG